MKKALGEANSLFDQGVGFQPYTASTVVPFSDQTTAAMGNLESTARADMASNPFSSAMSFNQGMFDNGGLSAPQTETLDQLRGVASGDELYGANPGFNKYLKQLQDDVRTYSDLEASGLGRYGSGMHTDVVGRRIGDVTDSALFDEYERQLGRQDAARRDIATIGQQGVSNRYQATDQAPGVYDAQFAPQRNLMAVGSMFEDLYGRTLADNQRVFQETQRAPMNAVEWLNAIGSGAGSLGRSTSGTSTVSEPAGNPWLQALGAGLGVNSLLNNPLGGLF